jgi:hypothetical protein
MFSEKIKAQRGLTTAIARADGCYVNLTSNYPVFAYVFTITCICPCCCTLSCGMLFTIRTCHCGCQQLVLDW